MILAQWLGRIPFSESEAILDSLIPLRTSDLVPDTLLFFEHPPTFSKKWPRQGVSSGILNEKEFNDYCRSREIGVHSSKRGGGIIYHGPGQIILGPIVKLKEGFGVPEYTWVLEETMIRTLKEIFGVEAFRIQYEKFKGTWRKESGEHLSLFGDRYYSGTRGVWVHDNEKVSKIGFLGMRFDLPVVSRGCALNLSPDLEAFSLIEACSIPGIKVTSVENICGKKFSVDIETAQKMAEIFCKVSDCGEVFFEDKSPREEN